MEINDLLYICQLITTILPCREGDIYIKLEESAEPKKITDLETLKRLVKLPTDYTFKEKTPRMQIDFTVNPPS